MKLTDKRIARSAGVVVFSAVLMISSSFGMDAVDSNMVANKGLTAGVASAFDTESTENINDINNLVLTAGAGTVLTDFNMVAVIDNSNSVVTAGQEETDVSDISEICGFKNVGICVVEGNLNVRDAASTDGSVIGKMTNNAACEILGVEGDWTKISSGSIEEGYVLSEFLVTGDEAKRMALDLKRLVATVTCDSLRIRREPSTDSDIIINVQEGEDVEVSSTDFDGWIQVNVDNDMGYVSAEFVELSEKLSTAHTLKELYYGNGVSDTRVNLCNNALQYLGNPYVWGGTSLTRGADCSGFVLSIYAQYGIYLPHSSRAQANYGTRISASEARPGDLFFYGSGGSISHVAIYIGGGRIVHASTESTGIIVSNAFYRSPICVTNLLGN